MCCIQRAFEIKSLRPTLNDYFFKKRNFFFNIKQSISVFGMDNIC